MLYTSCQGQSATDPPKGITTPEAKEVTTSVVPNNITRTIIQDRKGNIWLATFDGIFRYDGTSFTNMTSEISSSRFFSVLEDTKGNLWFGSIGSGVYRYDGKSFQNFTTEEGLVNNEVVCIYEDKTGNIWFGVNGGVSRYDGKSFQNFMLNGDTMAEDETGKSVPSLQRPPHEINSIIEDKTGKFWFGTRDNTFVYDGKSFTTVTHNGTPFTNVRWIIEDQTDAIWLGGNDGLWRYDGGTFSNLTKDFVGYIYEDSKGNIWTSSETSKGWALSRYDEKVLVHDKPIATEISSAYTDGRGMIFGILEAFDSTIWFGALDGVYRYDGTTVINAEGKDVENNWNSE